jgi:histidinol-phosphate aminotransferase
VRRALAEYPLYHIYPDPEQRELRKLLEGYAGLSAEHIVMGAGSDELIELVLRLFLEPGDKVINCVPTFGMYPFCTQVCGGRVVEVPRDGAYAMDVAAVKAALDVRTKVIFVTSPNNPSGNLTPPESILELLTTGVVIVVDEAYYEFSGATVANLVPAHENLIVLRSFSKWAGIAGLRVGYGLFPRGLAQFILKIKQPYNVNVAAQIAVKESLADIDCLMGTVQAIVEERGRLTTKLEEQGILEPRPSRANFILCAVKKGRALDIKRGLERKGIFIRHFDTPLLKDFLRISVGKPEHTDALIEALASQGGKAVG